MHRADHRRGLWLGALLTACAAQAAPVPGQTSGSGPVSFLLAFKNETTDQPLLGASVMPDEVVNLAAQTADADARFTLRAEDGAVRELAPTLWEWTAPSTPGLYRVVVTEQTGGESITLNTFVMVPYDGSETLNGYRIGNYEAQPLRGDPAYTRPAGFVEVTRENVNTPVSPHFKLGQFLCKQPGGFPKYVAVKERMLLKLEALLAHSNRQGLKADTFFVMSGFRTPWYNRSIGNSTTYSRHCYGDAADIYIDQDRDGVIDDLHADGRIDQEDGKVIVGLVDSLLLEAKFAVLFQGGLHLYPANAAHGPMVHVDTRGTPARW